MYLIRTGQAFLSGEQKESHYDPPSYWPTLPLITFRQTEQQRGISGELCSILHKSVFCIDREIHLNLYE